MATLQNSINANATTPLTSAQGGSGVSSPTAHGILVAEGSSAYNPITLSNGQLLIGSTGADPVAASLTAGTGISITPGAGTITIANTETAALTWNNVTGTTQTIATGNGYISNNAAQVTYTLPATAAQGTIFAVTGGISGLSSGSWKIAQNAGQTIHFGNVNSTTGTGGSLTSSNQYDSISILCVAANTDFVVLNAVGEVTVV